MTVKRVPLLSFRFLLSLILFMGLGVQTLCLHAQAVEISCQDSYMSLDPPPVVNETTTWAGFGTLDIKTLPMTNNRILETNPVSKFLGHYYDVRFTPNPELFELTGDVREYGERHTPNLPMKITNEETYRKYVARLRKETGSGQHFQNGLKTVGTSVVSAPYALVAGIMSVGMALPSMVDEFEEDRYVRNYRVQRNTQLLRCLESPQAEADILPRLQKVNALQQDYSDFLQNKRLLTYHVLPWLPTIERYKQQPYNVIHFEFTLKKAMPLQTFKNLVAQELAHHPNSRITYYANPSLPSKDSVDYPRNMPVFPTIGEAYITAGTLMIQDNFKSIALIFSGYTVGNKQV